MPKFDGNNDSKNFTRIGSGAFSSCSNLEKVNILGTMEFIEQEHFMKLKLVVDL